MDVQLGEHCHKRQCAAMLRPEVVEEGRLVDYGDAEAGGAGEVDVQEVAVLVGDVGQEVGTVGEVDLLIAVRAATGAFERLDQDAVEDDGLEGGVVVAVGEYVLVEAVLCDGVESGDVVVGVCYCCLCQLVREVPQVRAGHLAE